MGLQELHLSITLSILYAMTSDEQLRQLQARLEERFQSTIDELRSQIAQSNENRRPKASLPDPEKFSGQPIKFDTWKASILAKLAIDGPAIGSPTAQFYYVYLMLDSNVQAMVLPQLTTAQSSDQWDYQTIIDQLTRVYDNPNKVQEAEERFMVIKQGDDSLHQYIAKFERLR